jgi:hypothetical protein
MIDRNYLPFKSAREYADRGMAKWMGFFISEHSSSLSKLDETYPLSKSIEDDEIYFQALRESDIYDIM